MLCPSCSKLAVMHANKICLRCKGPVYVNISVICDVCSATHKQCGACLKNIVSDAQRSAGRGCGCGGKK